MWRGRVVKLRLGEHELLIAGSYGSKCKHSSKLFWSKDTVIVSAVNAQSLTLLRQGTTFFAILKPLWISKCTLVTFLECEFVTRCRFSDHDRHIPENRKYNEIRLMQIISACVGLCVKTANETSTAKSTFLITSYLDNYGTALIVRHRLTPGTQNVGNETGSRNSFWTERHGDPIPWARTYPVHSSSLYIDNADRHVNVQLFGRFCYSRLLLSRRRKICIVGLTYVWRKND